MSADTVIPKRRTSDWLRPAGLTEHPDYSVTLSTERQSACLGASWEIEQLAAHLASNVIPDDDPLHLVVRGIAGRIRSMSRVIISGLSDDSEPLANLEREVFGTARREAE
ncbi:hypothetical protein [Malikia sp.]|uniref:hypothetical protein n=1 Tax=Malikia sp. TaxID=2070706 RepID=UPI002608B3E3|nr:hypothetical protein [Malikia sp.]MDD2729729.1 hypothetical protein [Malikia sp.]